MIILMAKVRSISYRLIIFGCTAIAAIHSETVIIRPGLAFINVGVL